MLKKLLDSLAFKLLPYGCKYCGRRYRSLDKYHIHYVECWIRKKKNYEENVALSKIAPKNRAQRRKMAKKAGQIKDWRYLNED